MKTKLILLSALAGIFLSAASAQPSRSDMEAITMPPPRYDVTTDLTYTGDYGYYYVGGDREFTNVQDLGDPNLWYWVRYKNPGNVRNIWAWASMGRYDVCGHGHISYGVWGKYKYKFSFFSLTGWHRLGMGTKSGDPTSNGGCKWDVNNSLSSLSENFGWGVNYVNRDIRNSTTIRYTEFIVGSLAVSHGGYCSSPYNHCGHSTYNVLYSLP